MKRFACGSVLTLVASLLSAVTLSAQGTPTIANPHKPLSVTPPTVAAPPALTPAPSPSSASVLHTGRYQLRLQAPSQATGAQVTSVAEVNVLVTGTAVHITAGSPTDAFDGTMSGNQLQVHGVSDGANVTLIGAPTPSGVAGSLTTQDSTRIVHGTFALTVIHAAQLHKIEQYGSKPPAAPSKSWREIWHDFWCGLGAC